MPSLKEVFDYLKERSEVPKTEKGRFFSGLI